MWGRQTKAKVMRQIRWRQKRRNLWTTLGHCCWSAGKWTWWTLCRFRDLCSLNANALEINVLLSQRQDKLHEIGEVVFRMQGKPDQDWGEVETLCEEAAHYDEKIEQFRQMDLNPSLQETEDIKVEHTAKS